MRPLKLSALRPPGALRPVCVSLGSPGGPVTPLLLADPLQNRAPRWGVPSRTPTACECLAARCPNREAAPRDNPRTPGAGKLRTPGGWGWAEALGRPEPPRQAADPGPGRRALPPAPLGTRRRRRRDGLRAGHAQSPGAALASRKPVRGPRAGSGARRARGTRCSGGRAAADAGRGASRALRGAPDSRAAAPAPSHSRRQGAGCGSRRWRPRRLPRPGRIPEPSGMEPWRQCAQWLIHCKVLPANHRVTWDSAQVFDLAQTLRDGVLLCQLLNNLRARSINLKEINLRPQMSQVRGRRGRLRRRPASPINHPANFFVWMRTCRCARRALPLSPRLWGPLRLLVPWPGIV